jgi:Icc-related predicted phosphoesterase
MFKIAYVTDLHLPKDPSHRIGSLQTKMNVIKNVVNAFVFGGDTFALDRTHWDAIIKRKATQSEIDERRAFSRESAEANMKLIMDAAGGKPVIMINGNADFLAFEYLRQNSSKFSGLTLLSDAICSFSGYLFMGIGSIEPDNADSESILNFNPWYRGVVSKNERSKTFSGLLETAKKISSSCQKNMILVAHQPALGFVDAVGGRNAGSSSMNDFVGALNPIVHLTGHIHESPLLDGKYDFSRAYAKMPSGTISINPGGGNEHDRPEGVRMAVIDIERLACGLNPPGTIRPVA